MRRPVLSAFVMVILSLGTVDASATASAAPSSLAIATLWTAAAQTPSLPEPDPAHPPVAPAPAAGEDKTIRFNFKGATFQQVVDFFSRTTGLPVIWETPAPEGTLDYISPEAYDRSHALRVLNMILQSRGVMLRVSKDNLYLQKLDQMQREDIPTFVGTIPADITPDQIITVVRPMKIALAKPLAEKLATMVATYGSIVALEQQNALVITESAANVDRILKIVEQLDLEDPDGAVEVFAIQNAKATELMVPLKALLSQKVEKYVINQQGQQVKIEEEQMPGLSISADDRTNSIIAKGAQNKIAKLRETIELLDKPGVDQGRSMTTIALSRVTPAEAVEKLNQLYQRIQAKEKPTVLALDDANKIMILGNDSAITEGSLLIAELENGPIGADRESAVSVIPLQRAAPASLIGPVQNLLNKRQQSAVKLIAGTDGKSLIVAGPANDVEAVKALVPLLDRQTATNRQVRLVRIAGGDPGSVFNQASQLFVAANPDVQISNLKSQILNQAVDAPVSGDVLAADLDADSRLVTLIGPQRAIDSFTDALRQIEGNIIIDREARRFTLTSAVPGELVGPLNAMSSQLLQPVDGTPYIAPTFTAIDPLNTLVVTATPRQLETLQPLIESLDQSSSAAQRPVHILTIDNADANQLAANIDALFNTSGQPQNRPTVRVDAASNSLLIRATDGQFRMIEDLVSKIDKATIASSRQMRMIAVDPTKSTAEDVAAALRRMLDRGDSGKVQVISLEELIQQRQHEQQSGAAGNQAKPQMNADEHR